MSCSHAAKDTAVGQALATVEDGVRVVDLASVRVRGTVRVGASKAGVRAGVRAGAKVEAGAKAVVRTGAKAGG